MDKAWGVVAEDFSVAQDERLFQKFTSFQREEGEVYKSIEDFCDEFDGLSIQSLQFVYEYVFHFVPELPRAKRWKQVKKNKNLPHKAGRRISSFINPTSGMLTYAINTPGNSSIDALRDAKEQMEDYLLSH